MPISWPRSKQPGNDKVSQPFWWKAAQDIMTAVAIVFNELPPGRWELSYQLEATSCPGAHVRFETVRPNPRISSSPTSRPMA